MEDNKSVVTSTETEEKETNTPNTEKHEEKKEKLYTRAEVESIKAKERELLKQELETQKNEADKLAKMNADEKHKYELDKANKEKNDALAELNAYKLKETAEEIAKEKNMDISLLKLIDFKTETAETIKDKLELINSTYKKAVEDGIKNSFKEKTPKTVVNNPTKEPVSRASI